MQIKERVAAAPGYSLLAKAVSSTVSVIKADRFQGGAATNHVRREVSLFVWLPTALFSKSICYLSTFVKMILAPLKSIPAGFFELIKLSLECISKKALYSWLV